MTYLVLARKWRPRNFDTLVGQEHVVRALSQALSTQRLHHAWLFTGTRGVGKTTLSRILAKALNCQQGITPTPCGVCAACMGIDADRYVDYLELDAASNRGVEEMTKLLEQAVYAPSAGRFKVYMIDEVHMLTGHAFNAMLKTLEEPPPHVKFILATTDPQKIPVTVLSRCLQFNLKQMPPESIAGHLTQVLEAEAVPAEPQALRLIGQAARGSMRDALSLTDQAIAYSGGNVSEEAVRSMLGAIDQRYLVRLLDALAQADGPGMIAVADELAARSLSYNAALGDLAGLLSQVAMAQRIPGLPTEDTPLAADIRRLASLLPPDGVQLFYSIALHSRPELALAPDEYAGFVMACLRMLAFATDPAGGEPIEVDAGPAAARAAAAVPAAAGRAAPAAPAVPAASGMHPPAGEALSGPAAARAALAGLRGGSAGARGRAASPPVASAAPVTAPVPAAASTPPAAPAPAPVASAPAVVASPPQPSAIVTSESSPAPVQPVPGSTEGAEPAKPTAQAVPDTQSSQPDSAAVPAVSASVAGAPVPAVPAAAEVASPSAVSAPPDVAPIRAPQRPAAEPAGRSAGLAVTRPTAVAPASVPVDLPFPERAASAPRAAPTKPPAARSAPAAPRSAAPVPAPAARAVAPAKPQASPPAPALAKATPMTSPPPTARSGAAARPAPPPWESDEDETGFAPPDMDVPPWGESENPAPDDWPSPAPAPASAKPSPARAGASVPAPRPERRSAQASAAPRDAAPAAPRAVPPPARAVSGDENAPIVLSEPWPMLAMRLPLRGMSAELARQAEWSGVEGGTIVLTVPAQPMAQGPSVERLRAALIEHFGRPLQLRMQVGETGTDTAHAVAQSERDARQREAESAIEADPFVQALVQQFGGEIIPGSIKPA